MRGLIVIPVYNEEENLPGVVSKLLHYFDRNDLLFVNDGSNDGSLDILKNAGVEYLSHPVNLGYEETLRTGMEWVINHQYEFIAFFDSDGQHKVEDLVKMIELYEKHDYDLILGSRYLNVDSEFSLRSLGTKTFSKIASTFSGFRVTDVTCGLKIINRKFIPAVLNMTTEDMHAELVIGLSKAGAKIVETEIKTDVRTSGESMYHFINSLMYPAKTMVCILGELFFQHETKSEQD